MNRTIGPTWSPAIGWRGEPTKFLFVLCTKYYFVRFWLYIKITKPSLEFYLNFYSKSYTSKLFLKKKQNKFSPPNILWDTKNCKDATTFLRGAPPNIFIIISFPNIWGCPPPNIRGLPQKILKSGFSKIFRGGSPDFLKFGGAHS